MKRAWRRIAPALLLLLSAFVIDFAASGSAQTPTLRAPAPDQSEPSSKLPETDESLTRRLDRSDGVIRPPSDVDPAMSVPPKDPNAGASMPVIPPPTPRSQDDLK